jgi:hypothetical protein
MLTLHLKNTEKNKQERNMWGYFRNIFEYSNLFLGSEVVKKPKLSLPVSPIDPVSALSPSSNSPDLKLPIESGSLDASSGCLPLTPFTDRTQQVLSVSTRWFEILGEESTRKAY